jgi:dUTP pyrophosphatase
MQVTVKVVNNSQNPVPSYATSGSAGMDLKANVESAITLNPGQRVLIPTGLHIQLPEGYEAQIRPRSGLALKHGITVLNAPGTIDSDYTGDVGVILFNAGSEPFVINNGDRIAQMVIAQYAKANWKVIKTLETTERGDGGYGHTGI